jgi:hypothetical protein
MMLGDLLILLIIGYVLYKFVSGFLLPVVRASRHVREQFRNMQESPNDFSGNDFSARGFSSRGFSSADASTQSPGSAKPESAPRRSGKPPAEDYIDFEEIK